MNQVTERLRDCFRTVFPDLSDEQIETAVRAEIPDWDSLATLTLLAIFEEEFALELDDDAVAKLDSFEAMRNLVNAET